MSITLRINDADLTVDAPDDTPLLWVLRDELGMTGTKFGCGVAACGACTVHVDGEPTRSCSVPVSEVAGKSITTIEGLKSADGTLHAVQQAWIAAQVPQCGYCQSGQIMTAAAFLEQNPSPTLEEIDNAIDDVEDGIKRAVEIASELKTFSRLDQASLKEADIHEGLNSTLELMKSDLKQNNIVVEKHYSDTPKIDCLASKLNQVFMNTLNNAIYAIKASENKAPINKAPNNTAPNNTALDTKTPRKSVPWFKTILLLFKESINLNWLY